MTEHPKGEAKTPRTELCDYRFEAGAPCSVTESHAIHHGAWPGPEDNHRFTPPSDKPLTIRDRYIRNFLQSEQAERELAEALLRDCSLLQLQHATVGNPAETHILWHTAQARDILAAWRAQR